MDVCRSTDRHPAVIHSGLRSWTAAPSHRDEPYPWRGPAVGERLVVRGAREHNLKDVSLDLPRDALIVFTGLSGSGKSSLAFDTIFAEGQRRYVESLSSYARQFLGQMDKPDVDFIEGLSPAVSIDQKSTSRNPRSTVGTITEVYDYLRLLYARIGVPHCPICGDGHRPPDAAADRRPGARAARRAPGSRSWRRWCASARASTPTSSASCRPRATRGCGSTGSCSGSTTCPTLKKQEKHTIEVVVDRLTVKPESRRRLTDSVETALGLAGGLVVLDFVDLDDADPDRERTFSEHLACHRRRAVLRGARAAVVLVQLPVRRLPGVHRAGHPPRGRSGADRPRRRAVAGRGRTRAVVARPGVRLLPAAARGHVRRARHQHGHSRGEALPAKARTSLLHGHPAEIHVRYKNRYGRQRSYYTSYEGVIPFVQRRHAESDSDASRERFEGFMREVPCAACGGARLKPISLAVTVEDHCIADIAALPIGEAADMLRGTAALRARRRHRLPRAQGGQRAAAVPRRRRPALPVARPGGRHAGRRRGAAHPARDPDRLRAWSACCTCSTSPASGCTSATTTG